MISSVPILDFSLKFEPKEGSTGCLVVVVQNLHSSVAVTDLRLKFLLSMSEHSKTVQFKEDERTLQSIAPREVKESSFLGAGQHLHQLFEAMCKGEMAADALLGKTGEVVIEYAYQPAAQSIPVQSGSTKLSLTLRAFQGQPFFVAQKTA